MVRGSMDKIRFAAQSNTRCQHGCCTISVGVCVCVCVSHRAEYGLEGEGEGVGERIVSSFPLLSLSLFSCFSCWKMAT